MRWFVRDTGRNTDLSFTSNFLGEVEDLPNEGKRYIVVSISTPESLIMMNHEGQWDASKLDTLVMAMIEAFQESGLDKEYIIFNLGNTMYKLYNDD